MYEVNKFSPIFNILILKVDTRCAFHSDGCSFPTITSSMEMWKNVGLTFLNFCWGFGWSFFWTCYHFAFPIFSWNDWKCKQKQIIFIALTLMSKRLFKNLLVVDVFYGKIFVWFFKYQPTNFINILKWLYMNLIKSCIVSKFNS